MKIDIDIKKSLLFFSRVLFLLLVAIVIITYLLFTIHLKQKEKQSGIDFVKTSYSLEYQ